MLFDQLEKQEEKDPQDSDIKEPEPKLPSPVTEGEKETQNLVVITEEEFITAKRLLSNQRLNVGEQRYHRGRPIRADKIDDNEFTFYTDDALNREK